MGTKTKKLTETTAETKHHSNGTYEFLLQQFKEPSTISKAATALTKNRHLGGKKATEKVEQFLENAKLDRALEVRAGTGSNEGQFIIAQVPQGAQRKRGGGAGQKAPKVAAEKKGPSLRMFLLTSLETHPLSKEEALILARKHFPALRESTLATVFTDNIGGHHLYLPKGWEVIAEKKEGVVLYQTKQLAV